MSIDLAQLGILLLGPSSAWCLNQRGTAHRWGYLLALLSQPFWFWMAFQHGQWVLILLGLWYTYCWTRGVWHHWIRQDSPASPPSHR